MHNSGRMNSICAFERNYKRNDGKEKLPRPGGFLVHAVLISVQVSGGVRVCALMLMAAKERRVKHPLAWCLLARSRVHYRIPRPSDLGKISNRRIFLSLKSGITYNLYSSMQDIWTVLRSAHSGCPVQDRCSFLVYSLKHPSVKQQRSDLGRRLNCSFATKSRVPSYLAVVHTCYYRDRGHPSGRAKPTSILPTTPHKRKTYSVPPDFE